MFGITRVLALTFSAMWLGICGWYLHTTVGLGNLSKLAIGDQGMILTGIFLPLVLTWSLLVTRAKERHGRILLAQKIDSLKKVQILPDTLDNHIAAITDAFHRQAREFHASAEESLGTFAQMSVAYEEQTRNMAAFSASLQEQRDYIQTLFDHQTSALTNSEKRTEALFSTIEDATRAAQRVGQEISAVVDGDLVRANNSLNVTAGNVKGLTSEIWDQLKNLETAYSSSQGMAEEAKLALEQQAHEIGHVTRQAVSEVDAFAEKLEPRISQIEEIGAKAADLTSGIENQIAAQKESMEGVGESLTSKAKELESAVKSQAESLEALLDSFDERSTSLTETFETKVTDILSSAEKAGRTIEEKISVAGAGLKERTNELGDSVAERLKEMEAQATDFDEKLQTQVNGLVEQLDGRIKEAGESILKFETSLEEAGQKATNNVGQMVSRFAGELDEAGQQSMQSVLKLAQELPEMTKAISDTAEGTALRLQNAGGDIVAQSQHLARSAADLMSYGDQIRSDLKRLPSDLMVTTEELDNKVREASEQVIAKYSEVGEHVVSTAEHLQEANVAIEKRLEEVSAYYEELKAIGSEVESNINAQTHLIDTSTSKARLAWHEAQKAMQLHADETIEFSDEYISNVTRVAEVARREVEDLDRISQTAVGAVQSTSQAVGGKLREFASSVTELKDLVNSVGGSAAQHRKMLNEAGLEAEHRARKLTDQMLANQKDAFLKDAGALVGRLNQSAIDVEQIMMGELSPEIIQAYQAGDKGISVRRLLKRKTPQHADRISSLYHSDASFNAAVETYLKTFKDLLDQSKVSDPSKLLHTTFLTGDLGKLYIFLTQSLGQLEAAA